MIRSSELRQDQLQFITAYPSMIDVIDKTLWAPLEDFLSSPGKNVRPRLVEIGYLLSTDGSEVQGEEVKEALLKASEIVESVHAGALIIDDIQDGSIVRRNRESMHVKYGVPLALNAGNWLYFWAIDRIKALGLSSDVRLALMEDSVQLLLEAHYGQALDIGTSLSHLKQSEIAALCRSSMELKTSTLMALALRLGSAVAGKCELDSKLVELGRQLGFVLQVYDDVGNFLQPSTLMPSKRWEDLRLKRPSWVWTQVALQANEGEFKQFILALETLPDESLVHEFSAKFNLKEKLLKSAKLEIIKLEKLCLKNWEHSHQETKTKILSIANQLEKAYV